MNTAQFKSAYQLYKTRRGLSFTRGGKAAHCLMTDLRACELQDQYQKIYLRAYAEVRAWLAVRVAIDFERGDEVSDEAIRRRELLEALTDYPDSLKLLVSAAIQMFVWAH